MTYARRSRCPRRFLRIDFGGPFVPESGNSASPSLQSSPSRAGINPVANDGKKSSSVFRAVPSSSVSLPDATIASQLRGPVSETSSSKSSSAAMFGSLGAGLTSALVRLGAGSAALTLSCSFARAAFLPLFADASSGRTSSLSALIDAAMSSASILELSN